MIKTSFTLYKNEGETPLACMERFREENPEYAGLPMTYAGRLDPMASGILLVLAGEECKNKDNYLGLDKEYEVEILFGIGTDTHDPLGIVGSMETARELAVGEIEATLKNFIGTFEQAYPLYSSKPYRGKPLFAQARAGAVALSDAPKHMVKVHSIELLGMRTIQCGELIDTAIRRIEIITGDFRQDECIKSWLAVLERIPPTTTLQIANIRACVGTGTYMRQLVGDVGKELTVPALAWKIFRTKIEDTVVIRTAQRLSR